jgi:transposase
MQIEVLGIDLAKQVFQLHAVDARGRALSSRRVGRAKLVETVVRLAPRIVAMEACSGAHHWARTFRGLGMEVRLLHAKFVRAYVKSAKNDTHDAEAICEAAMRPHMRFVVVKSLEQQDLQSLHRSREQLVGWRTALINQLRGLLAEYGIVLPQGARRFSREVTAALDEPSGCVTALARELFTDLIAQLRDLHDRIQVLDRRLVALCRQSESARRLACLPGIGPIVATALVASVGDGKQFRNGRELAAWVGLVPRQHSSGGKPRLLGISRSANRYLRKQMVHGARGVMRWLKGKEDPRSRWLLALWERRGFNRAVVAQANKTARMAWVILARGEAYRPATT